MALLLHLATGNQHILSASHLVGRSHACALRLANRMVSAEHASIRWSRAGWEVRDLNSSNGTFVDQRRLLPGETVHLTARSSIAFGDASDLYQMGDDSPPIACAYGNDGSVVYADDGVLSLPPGDPEWILFEEGHWFIEAMDGEHRRIENGEEIECGGRTWRIALPLAWEQTWQPPAGPLRIASVGLHLRVSRDQEHVEVTLLHGGSSSVLGARVHGYLLVALARERIRDASRVDLPESEHGWTGVHDLLRELDTSEGMLNVAICRLRAQFREAGVIDASRLIERRRTTRQLRLGISSVEISNS